ncbi:hypothetical protein BK655_03770 [Pseudomonas brassicacearum]|nr:hypothetical protein CVG87_08360 [Pseudomonas sp. WCS365]ROM87742.1 hypothetical protein BK655_03770 [Pseudomonas brassicacearum]ROM92970.1 hypothetical protein BK656_17690 [Pseudomonas brassicacearum]RON07027.1 hypothetical protein BK657_03610 [Pseudomonas brassicacearum]
MQELCRSRVGAVECSEAAIFPQTLEPQAKDQKIAAFGSSYINTAQAICRHLKNTSIKAYNAKSDSYLQAVCPWLISLME